MLTSLQVQALSDAVPSPAGEQLKFPPHAGWADMNFPGAAPEVVQEGFTLWLPYDSHMQEVRPVSSLVPGLLY